MEPAATVSTPTNFADHLAAQDSGASANDNAVPDHSPQVNDEPAKAPVDPNAPLDPADEDTGPIEEPADGPDEVAELEQLRQLKAELDGDALPATLATKTFPVKIDGRTYDVPVAELAQGYQRNADYSRKMAEVKQIAKRAEQVEAGATRLLEDLNNGERLLRASKEMGFYKALVEAARTIGRQRLALQELSPEARQYALQLEEERDARELATRRAQQLEQQMREAQAQQPNQEAQHLRHQLEQMVPRAFAKHKIGDYPLARDLFGSNLQNLHEGGELTAATIDAAAQATAEQLQDIAARLPKEQRVQNANGQPIPARRTATAPGRPIQRQKGGTVSDFSTHLDRLNGSR